MSMDVRARDHNATSSIMPSKFRPVPARWPPMTSPAVSAADQVGCEGRMQQLAAVHVKTQRGAVESHRDVGPAVEKGCARELRN